MGPQHPNVTFPLNGLGYIYYKQGKDEQAEPLFQRTLRIREEHIGCEHPYVTYSLLGLANIYTRQGNYEQAEPLFQQAIRIREQQLGPEHYETVEARRDFAELQRAWDQ